MLAQQDRNIADERNKADYAANNIFFAVEEELALGVELSIICEVVVALGEQTKGCFAMIMSALAQINIDTPQFMRIVPLSKILCASSV